MITRLRRISPIAITQQVNQIKRVARRHGLRLYKQQSKPIWEVRDGNLYCLLRWSVDSHRWVVEPGNSELLTVNIKEILRSLGY